MTTDPLRRFAADGDTIRTELGRRVYVLAAAEVAGGPIADAATAGRLGDELARTDHGPGCNCPLVDVGASPVYAVAIRACRV